MWILGIDCHLRNRPIRIKVSTNSLKDIPELFQCSPLTCSVNNLLGQCRIDSVNHIHDCTPTNIRLILECCYKFMLTNLNWIEFFLLRRKFINFARQHDTKTTHRVIDMFDALQNLLAILFDQNNVTVFTH